MTQNIHFTFTLSIGCKYFLVTYRPTFREVRRMLLFL